MKPILASTPALLLFFWIATASAQVSDKTSTGCYQTTLDDITVHYCVQKAENSVNPDVVYYFHGAYGDAQEWINSNFNQRIYDAWGVQAPTVVSVSYGTLWLLAEPNASASSGLYNHFINTALPAIERNRNLHPARRLLTGASMGGFNASQIYLKKPDLFSKVVLLCPALADLNPFASSAEVNAYVERTHANRSAILNFMYLAQIYFPSRDAYKKADPFLLGQTQINGKTPPLLVTVGLQDEYGFFEGSEEFVDLATENEANATYLPLAGRHCTWDWKAAAQFLIEP